MCLDTVDKEIKVKEGIGWKAFLGEGDKGLKSVCQEYPQPAGKWLKDTRTEPLEGYPAGFHIHTSKADAERWISTKIRPLRFRNVVATGRLGLDNVIVAREIRIFTAKESQEYDK